MLGAHHHRACAMTLPFCLPSSYQVASSQRWGRRRVVTAQPTSGGDGWRQFLFLRPGFYVATSSIDHHAPAREVYASGDFVKMHLRLAGDSQVSQPGHRGCAVDASSVSTLLQPAGTRKEEVFQAGVHERSVTLCCSRAFLLQDVGLPRRAQNAGPIAAFLGGPAADFALARYTLSPAQAALAADLVDGPSLDALASLRAEAKAFELLHSVLTALDAAPAARTVLESSSPGVHDAGTTQERQAQRLAALKRHVDASLGEPFEAAALARRFGFSESGLARAFRLHHGMALFDYVALARAERARALLEEGRLSVTDIALDVGYGHTGNFSTAFKRRYGMSPVAYRKMARPGAPA